MTPSQRRALEALLADPTKKALLQEAQKRGYQLDVAALDRHDVRPAPREGSPEAAARSGLQPFMRHLYRGYQSLPLHALISAKLEAVLRGECRRLIITIPPRFGKSLHASIHFPALYLGHNPDHRILHVSFSAELVEGFSRQARDLVLSDEYGAIFPDVRVSDDSRSVARWDLAPPYRGGYAAVGVGGALTGRGAHLLLLDDPISGDAEARSETALENLWQWYTQTAYTRLEENGVVILIATRWHHQDLIGRLLEMEEKESLADRWEVLRLPALAEADDPLGRQEGESLWPEKFPHDRLMTIRANNPRSFEALYQQNPSLEEGNIFKREWWQTYNPLLHHSYRLIEVHYDTAVKKGSKNDYTACWVGALTWDNRIHVIEVWWERLDFPEAVARIGADYDRLTLLGLRPSGIYIEDKASGSSLYQALVGTRSPKGAVLPVDTILPEGDKEARAIAATTYYKTGLVLEPERAPWADDYHLLMERFPAHKIKDPVDASTQGVTHLMQQAQMLSNSQGIPAAGGTRPTFVVPHSPVAASPLFAAGGLQQDYLIGARARTPYR